MVRWGVGLVLGFLAVANSRRLAHSQHAPSPVAALRGGNSAPSPRLFSALPSRLLFPSYPDEICPRKPSFRPQGTRVKEACHAGEWGAGGFGGEAAPD